MRAAETVEGWSNFETWQANLQISNDRYFYNEVMRSAKTLAHNRSGVDQLANILMETFEAARPKTHEGSGVDDFWHAIVERASDSVDWNELAEEWIAHAKE